MTRISVFALLMMLVSSASHADGPVMGRANAANLNTQAGITAHTAEGSKAHARSAFDGRDRVTPVVAGKVSYQGNGLTVKEVASGQAVTVPGPQVPASEEGKKKSRIPKWAHYAAGAALGGLQGALSYGLMGALGGAGIGLGVSYLYAKGDYGAAIGASAGSIVGGFLGGPVGALLGAVVGGLLGHFIGKLFK